MVSCYDNRTETKKQFIKYKGVTDMVRRIVEINEELCNGVVPVHPHVMRVRSQ